MSSARILAKSGYDSNTGVSKSLMTLLVNSNVPSLQHSTTPSLQDPNPAIPVSEPFIIFRCDACEREQRCDFDQTVNRLMELSMLRRNAQPDAALLAELVADAAPRLTCAECDSVGLTVLNETYDDAEWGELRKCTACGEAISAERLEVFPDTRRCTACQKREEQPPPPSEDSDFCPRCGTPLQTRTSAGGGLTRYRLFCPTCGR